MPFLFANLNTAPTNENVEAFLLCRERRKSYAETPLLATLLFNVRKENKF